MLSFILVLSAQAQKKAVSVQSYTDAENKCDQSIKKENWKTAELLCKNALRLANQLADKNKPEKMRAYENYAYVLFSQSKFQFALNNFTKAFEIGKTFLTENDSDLAYAYLNLGRANQGLSKLEKAVEYYKKAEQIYRNAYEKDSDSESKAKLKDSIKRTLILQRYIAAILNDENLFKEVVKKMADLDKQEN